MTSRRTIFRDTSSETIITTMVGGGNHGGVLIDGRRYGIICLIFGMAVLCGVVSSSTDPGDIAALQAIHTTLIDGSNSLSSWGGGGDPCSDGWVGIYCVAADYPSSLNGSNFSHVTELRLFRLNLHGSLAQEIGNLPALKYLNFMWNYISGSIPTTIGKLQNLKLLLLSGNQLTGALPRELGFLSSLSRIQIDENSLSGEIPDTFVYPNLGGVQHIQLNNNSLNGSIPVGLTNLSTILYLFLENNNFTGSLPVGIVSMPNLVTVQLDNNKFDSIPQDFGTMVELIRVSLSNCGLTGGVPNFNGSNSLAVVDLSYNSLTGNIVNATLSANLTTIDLSYNNLSGSVPNSVASLLSLQILELRGNQISGLSPSSLPSARGPLAPGPFAPGPFAPGPFAPVVDLEDNLITDVANGTDLLALQGPGGSTSVWLSGNPFCNSQQNNPLCVDKSIAVFLDLGGVNNATPPPFYLNTCSSACSAPYALAATVSQPNDCRCVIPITVQWQLESPSFSLFGPPIMPQFTTYLASGLNVDVSQVQVPNYSYQQGKKILLTLLLFPTGAQFDSNEVARIYTVFSNWNIPTSGIFGPYNLISFSVPATVPTKTSHGLSGGAIAGIVVGVLAFVVLKTLCMYYTLKYWLIWKGKRRDRKEHYRFIRRHSTKKGFSKVKVASVKEFMFEDIVKATDNFCEDRLVGAGGYGKVYSGTLEDGQKVAVKVAEEGSYQGSHEFETEIQLLSRVHHRNLVSLVGYCNENGEQVLIYEYVAYGSLLWHLSPAARLPLTFITRLQIALDTARGIHYLHTEADPPIYHRDVKASNILLDEKFHAKVSDFGLSKLAPQPDLAGMVGHVSTVVKGTPGYLDPEYFKTHRLTDKSDVYSFGVVLLVLMTGEQPIVDGKNLVREVNMAYDEGQLARMVDPRIRGAYPHRAMEIVTRLALICCMDNPRERPTISEVLAQLEELWKDTNYSDGDTAETFSGNLREDYTRSEDSFFELDPSKTSSQNSSTMWSNNAQSNGSNDEPGPINIVNPR